MQATLLVCDDEFRLVALRHEQIACRRREFDSLDTPLRVDVIHPDLRTRLIVRILAASVHQNVGVATRRMHAVELAATGTPLVVPIQQVPRFTHHDVGPVNRYVECFPLVRYEPPAVCCWFRSIEHGIDLHVEEPVPANTVRFGAVFTQLDQLQHTVAAEGHERQVVDRHDDCAARCRNLADKGAILDVDHGHRLCRCHVED